MQFVPTRIHGALDHLVALVLLAAPWALGLDLASPAALSLILPGLCLAAANFCTDYEWGVFRRLPVPLHSGIEILIALSLVAAPWLLRLDAAPWAPHTLIGALLILGALTTNPRPYGLSHAHAFAVRLASQPPSRPRA